MRTLILGSLFLIFGSSALAAEDASTLGKQAAVQMDKYLKGNLNSFKEALSGNSQMKTPSGESFNATVGSPATPKGTIRLVVQGGDLYASITGKLAGAHVSGICENGYISCSPGTWNNCVYYVYDGSSFKPATSAQELIGCFCVSEGACNFKWSEDWLKWALNKFTQILGYSDATFADVITPTSATRDFGAVNGERVSEAQMADKDAALQEVESNSVVQGYMNNPYNEGNSLYTCTIRHIPVVKPVYRKIPCDNVVSIFGEEYCYLGRSPTVSESGSFSLGAVKLYPQQNLVGRIVRDDSDCRNNYKYIAVFKDGSFVQKVEDGSEVWACGPGGVVWNAIVYWNNSQAPEEGSFSFQFYDHDSGDATARIHLEVYQKRTYKDDELYTEDSGQCLPKEGCRLKDEKICDLAGNCVYTRKNFAPTGQVPPVQQITVLSKETGYLWTITATGNAIVARNQYGEERTLRTGEDSWFVIERTYLCPETGIDVSSAINRGTQISDSSYFDGSKVGYSGQMGCSPVNGKWVCYANGKVYSTESACEAECSYKGEVAVGSSPYPTCTVGNSTGFYVCKVAIYGNEVRTAPNGSSLEPNQIDFNGINYEYRPCEVQVDNDGSVHYVCPVSQGEQVIKDCTCDTSDEALKAISTIEALNQMSHDVICSSSPP